MEHDRLIRIREVISLVGLSKSSIYALIADQRFPKQRRIGKRAVAFLESEVLNWVQSQGAGR